MSRLPDEPGSEWEPIAPPAHSPRTPATDEQELLPVASIETMPCWRCGKVVAVACARCPYCRAVPNRAHGQVSGVSRAAGADTAAVRVLAVFAILLVISIFFGLLLKFGFKAEETLTRTAAERILTVLSGMELLDTAVIGIALLWVGSVGRPERPSLGTRLAAWGIAAPVLVVLMLVNIAYQWLLCDYLRLPLVRDDLIQVLGLSAWVWVVYCVQPALVEELFFRYLALGSLLEVCGTHGAVWLSAVMFALAHIYAPTGMPYLLLAGVVLGYARILSGGLVLPVLLHFGHNALVVSLDRFL